MDAKKAARTDGMKRVVQGLVGAFHKFVKSADDLREDLESHPNGAVQKLFEIKEETMGHVEKEYQRKWASDVLDIFLWIYSMDTVYRSQGDWMLARILEARDEILPHLDDRPPAEWYANLWANDEDGDFNNQGMMMRFASFVKDHLGGKRQ